MSEPQGVADEVIRLTFREGMTLERSTAQEDLVVEAMRRSKLLEFDLSAVTEVDLSGQHLLSLLTSVGNIVAMSPVVVQTLNRSLPTNSSYRGREPVRSRDMRSRP